MKLKKTDRRFKLYHYGFDCYIEPSDWKQYTRCKKICEKTFGNRFLIFHNRVYNPSGKWHPSMHSNYQDTNRIYLRGEKYYTLLMMSMPEQIETL